MRKRRQLDVAKLMTSKYAVLEVNDTMDKMLVEFPGPTDSLYQGGIFKVSVELPENYPLKSPSVGFSTKIFHPNVDESSGSICLDVINQAWSPMYDLVNIFDVFLPQLLLYPNPSDPLNGAAASLMSKNREAYNQRVRELVQRAIPQLPADCGVSDLDDANLSELSDTSDIDLELL